VDVDLSFWRFADFNLDYMLSQQFNNNKNLEFSLVISAIKFVNNSISSAKANRSERFEARSAFKRYNIL
jgi:hypothetical protein